MKIIRGIWLLFLIMSIIPGYSFLCQDSAKAKRIQIGLEIGVNHSSIMIQDGEYLFEGINEENTFPLGFNFNFFIETKLLENLSLINEISYKHANPEIKGSTTSEGIRTNKFLFDYIGISFLPKYEILSNSSIPYLIMGCNLDYLVSADYEWYDEIYTENKGARCIKDELPTIMTSICFGLGKQFTISDLLIFAEFRYLLGITEYKLESFEKWRQNELQFLVGLQIY